ncbi:MAG TPA: molybdopterin-guanine dinucleotide biosynthesis protein B [Candidatus Lokiarchaeia archaeon]|nr:molybdopterin-guanine dinucleotide biosynthesis protein B [Candidatus Lokiarchaeia archaeon]
MVEDNVLFVIGKSDAGKTTFIVERLLPLLVARGYSVGVIKDIHIEGFTIDQEGKDTWRQAKAGASIVVARGLDETDMLFQHHMELEEILPSLAPVDIIIAEGFKELHGKKIIIARSEMDYHEMSAMITDEDDVFGVAGPIIDEGTYDDAYPLLSSEDDLAALVDKIEPLAKRARLRRNRLAMPLESLACTATIDAIPLPMKDYVADTLKNVIIGAIAALHWNMHDPVASIKLSMARTEPPEPWSLAIQINEKNIELKEFVQHSIAGTILGYLATLRLPDEVSLAMCTAIAIDMIRGKQ